MKKYFRIVFSAVFLHFLCFFAMAEEQQNNRSFFLSFTPLAGIKNSQASEYVFYNYSIYKDSDKLSQLNWNIDHSPFAGADLEGGWKKFFCKAGFKATMTGDCGTITDSDWQNIQANSGKVSPSVSGIENYKTHYSFHDNSIEYDYSLSFYAGGQFPVLKTDAGKMTLKPYAGYEFSTFKFIASDGELFYGNQRLDYPGYYYPYNDEEHRNPAYGKEKGNAISYTRYSNITWLGLDTIISDEKHLQLTTGFALSPFVYLQSLDRHLKTHNDYADITYDTFSAFKIKLELEIFLNRHLSFLTCGNFMWTSVLRGENYEKTSTEKYYNLSHQAEGGASEQQILLYVGLKIKIF